MSKNVTTNISSDDVKHVAELSAIPISEAEAIALSQAFEETLAVIDNLRSVDVSRAEPTHQVTGLTNITRPDEVNHETMFTQTQALANASSTHNGYFVVDQVVDKDA